MTSKIAVSILNKIPVNSRYYALSIIHDKESLVKNCKELINAACDAFLKTNSNGNFVCLVIFPSTSSFTFFVYCKNMIMEMTSDTIFKEVENLPPLENTELIQVFKDYNTACKITNFPNYMYKDLYESVKRDEKYIVLNYSIKLD